MTAVKMFDLSHEFVATHVQNTLKEVFKLCTDSDLSPLTVIETDRIVRASTGIIAQPMKMFKTLIVIAEAQINEIDNIHYVVKLYYKWEHFDGGTNGSQIATVFFMQDGSVKYRNYLSSYNQIVDLELDAN